MKPIAWGCKLWPRKEWLDESMLFTFAQIFHKLCLLNCSICLRLPFYQVFVKCYFKNPQFQLQKNIPQTNKMTWVIIASTGINGVSLAHYNYLLNKHGDLSFCCILQNIVGNIYGNFEKLFNNFFSEESSFNWIHREHVNVQLVHIYSTDWVFVRQEERMHLLWDMVY